MSCPFCVRHYCKYCMFVTSQLSFHNFSIWVISYFISISKMRKLHFPKVTKLRQTQDVNSDIMMPEALFLTTTWFCFCDDVGPLKQDTTLLGLNIKNRTRNQRMQEMQLRARKGLVLAGHLESLKYCHCLIPHLPGLLSLEAGPL
jgi:hypothetical protein